MQIPKKPINILVVDDSEDVREVMVETLRVAGYFVVGVENAEAAIDTMKTLKFRAIITDVDMPGMNGFELSRLIRKQCPETGIILVTGSHTPDVTDIALELGIEFMLKPFDMASLQQKLECLLGINN